MTVAYQMPVRTELAKKVGPRLWRKTILKAGHISKGDVNLDVDRAYMQTLVDNFAAGAKDQVQFQLVDGQNRHNDDPERYRGHLQGLELTADDQLVGIFVTTDAGAKLLTDNPRLGASVSLVDRYERADGRRYGPTLLHVAGTPDPEIAGLGDWVRADLSASCDAEVIDFTMPDPAISDPQTPAVSVGELVPPTTEARATVPTQLTEEELAAAKSALPLLLKLLKTDDTGGDVIEAPAAEETAVEPEFTDAELDAMTAGTADTETEGEPEQIAASAERDEALELANSRIDAQQLELAALRGKLDREGYIKERDHLAREFHVPPSVTELCKEWLTGATRVELSSGKSANPGDAIRAALKLFAQTGPLDLSGPVGTAHELSAAQAQQSEDEAFVAAQHARNGR